MRVLAFVVALSMSAAAQEMKPAPRMPNGKPDLSGVVTTFRRTDFDQMTYTVTVDAPRRTRNRGLTSERSGVRMAS